MLAATHRPGRRLPRLSPFDPEQQHAAVGQRLQAAADYGCVEWFQYLEHAKAPRATAVAPMQHRRGVRRP
ncbi:MAG: hypothetical protein KGJ68_09740 [Gammaproteobacteria bacterium]|nr:hypothetical protein [Gammaproteobacteria bacterium]